MSLNRLYRESLVPLLLIAIPQILLAQTFVRVTIGDIVNNGGASFGHSWGDYNNDSFPDLLVNNPQAGQTNFFYENNGDGSFSRRTDLAFAQVGPTASSTWGDYDNDGHVDVFLANGGTSGASISMLYKNNGNGTFTRINSNAFSVSSAFTVCSWVDSDNDGDLDLFLGRSSGNNFLFRNDGNDAFVRQNLSDNGGTWGVSWTDYDNDGDMDLFGSNYGLNNYLYRNNGGTFSRITAGPAVSGANRSLSASWGDFDNDGDFDLFVSNAGGRNRLFRNQGNGTFSEITDSPIVTPVENSEGSCWADLDNDGDLDLVVAGGGNVAIGQNAIFTNDGNGSFTRLFSGDIVSLPGRYEGATCIDFDKDGDLDLFFSNYNNLDNVLFRNTSSPQNWINLTCVGVQSNRSAIGARLELKATIGGKSVSQVRQITAHSGHVAQGGLDTHFGLGDATSRFAHYSVARWHH